MLGPMARIRIVDEWLRSPVSPPSRYRAILVIADSWAEQRVLMRAFASSPDQTRPTIVLRNQEFAIGPAGTDPHGEWGIHVQPPVDGHAQALRGQLELAAQRIAGSKGTPARLEDELSSFERKRTGNWIPDSEDAPPPRQVPCPTPAAGTPTMMPMAGPVPTPPAGFRRRRRGWTSPVPTRPAPPVDGASVGKTTALGYASGAAGVHKPAHQPRTKARLGAAAGYTVPLGFRLSDAERNVLNALGESSPLTARHVAEIAGAADGVEWMEALMAKLADHGIDLIEPGDDIAGEPTYLLRR